MRIAVLPYEDPYEFARGTSLGWWMIRLGLESIEEYSVRLEEPFLYEEIEEHVISMPVGVTGEEWVQRVEALLPQDLVGAVGGNHLVSLPVVKKLTLKHKKLYIVHLDAHLDRRNEWLGERYNYATVFKRIEEVVGKERITTLGWRSTDPKVEEYEAHPIPPDVPLYLSLDMDWFDPSVFPCVSNPEPGGAQIKDLYEFLERYGERLVAFDLVEYNPLMGPPSCMATAAVVFRELAVQLKHNSRLHASLLTPP